MRRSLSWSTSLPFLMAFMAYGAISSRASGESKLAAEAPEVVRSVTVRIEGAVPHSDVLRHNLSVGAKTALITVLSIVVFGMLVLIRAFNISSHLVPQGLCACAVALLACGGVAAICALMGHPRFRLDGGANAAPLSTTIGEVNNTSVYIAVVEGEGSPANDLHPGKYLLIQTTGSQEQLERGTRLSVTVESTGPSVLDEGASATTAVAH
jgi:hypothetical protein